MSHSKHSIGDALDQASESFNNLPPAIRDAAMRSGTAAAAAWADQQGPGDTTIAVLIINGHGTQEYVCVAPDATMVYTPLETWDDRMDVLRSTFNGFKIEIKPGCTVAPDHTYYTLRNCLASEDAEETISMLRAKVAKLEAQHRALRAYQDGAISRNDVRAAAGFDPTPNTDDGWGQTKANIAVTVLDADDLTTW